MKLMVAATLATKATAAQLCEYKDHVDYLIPDTNGITIKFLGVGFNNQYKTMNYSITCERSGVEAYCEIDFDLINQFENEDEKRALIAYELEVFVESVIQKRDERVI